MEKHCSTDAAGRRRWGADHWRVLKRRLIALAAARTLQDLQGVPGKCHQLVGDRAEQFALYLWGPYRLVFSPDHEPVPRREDGGVDWSQVTRIVILEVVDYHGD